MEQYIKKRVNSHLTDLILITTTPVALLVAATQKSCEQGDWLTCSGSVAYEPAYYLLNGYAFIVLALNLLILPVFFGKSIGKFIFGLCIVKSEDLGKPKIAHRILRAALNTAMIPMYAVMFPISLIEIVLIRAGKIEHRVIDKILGLKVVSNNGSV